MLVLAAGADGAHLSSRGLPAGRVRARRAATRGGSSVMSEPSAPLVTLVTPTFDNRRDGQRPAQDRPDRTARLLAHRRGSRTCDRGLGLLVERQPAAQRLRRHPSGRVRGSLPSRTRGNRRGLIHRTGVFRIPRAGQKAWRRGPTTHTPRPHVAQPHVGVNRGDRGGLGPQKPLAAAFRIARDLVAASPGSDPLSGS
jgi:hypothetical protein